MIYISIYIYWEMRQNSTLAQLQSMKHIWLPFSQEAKPWLVQEVCDPVDRCWTVSSFFYPRGLVIQLFKKCHFWILLVFLVNVWYMQQYFWSCQTAARPEVPELTAKSHQVPWRYSVSLASQDLCHRNRREHVVEQFEHVTEILR
jgi:hypothetical protein